MKKSGPRIVFLLFLIGMAGLGYLIYNQYMAQAVPVKSGRGEWAAPVEVAEIRNGTILLQRTFSGELEALAEFVVAPKVSGRVEQVFVHVSDTVKRGQVVAELDNDEYVQAVAQAKADLEVARANLAEAGSALEIAGREYKRTESLVKRGIASDSEFDAVKKDRMAKEAQVQVAEAQVMKAEASLKTAEIRLGYTKVTAGWSGGGEDRVVAERYVDEGQTVAANAPLLLIVEMNPIVGVVYVSEKDYANLKPGQNVSLTTDAYPGETFKGRIERIAPVFRTSTRQARIEMTIDNPTHRLKPGMFIKAVIILSEVAGATIIPEEAITMREGKSGVFIVSDDGKTVSWRDVTTGIRDSGAVQVMGEGIRGRVVTLGQQLVNDGALITIPDEHKKTAESGNKG